MGTEFSADDVDNCEEVGEIIAVVQENIDSLKNFIAKRDVDVVRRSTKGLGTDEASMVNSLCNRTKKQLEAVDALYHETYESSLLSVVSEEVSGNFGKMVTYSLMETDDYGADVFSAATEGLGTKERILVDLVHTHTNEQLAAIKEKWEAKNNESMMDSITDELGGNARRILMMLLFGEKSECDEVDPDLATEQAATLQEALASDLLGSEEDPFLDILGTQSRAQIQEIKGAFERDHGMSLMRAVNKACRGTYRMCLLGCLFPSSEAYTAYALFKAFEGLGTDEDRVTRILGGTDKKKMAVVCAYYKETYGKHLVEDLKEELNGTFLKAAMSWAAGADPTRGMEGVTARLAEEVEEDPDKEKDLAKALLQERLNLRDFICQADAGDIRAATKGLGTDDSLMVSIVCSRTKAHLARVDHHYLSMFGKSLSKQIKQECFGTYREFLTYTMMSDSDLDALLLKKSMDGLGTKERLMIFVLAPQDNARILAARERYDEKYSPALIDRVQSELRGDLEKIVLALINGSRQEDVVDEELAEQQAQELYDAGIGKRFGTDEETFIRILTEASRPQIQLIRQFYEQNHEMSLERAIKKEFSGDRERMLLALVKKPLAYYALQLKDAFDGVKTDRGVVARVLGSHDKHFVRKLDLFYQETYGETLMEALKRETGGKFRRAVLTWVCSSGPEHPGNNLEEAFDGLDDDEEEEEPEEEEEEREIEPEPEPEAEEFEPPPPSYEESAAEYSQYYQPPPPPSGCYVVGFVQESQVQSHRAPPPPCDEDDFDDLDDDDDLDEYFAEPLEGASDEQMMELRRLARIRTRALMMGDAYVVNRAQGRIRYLKWEIENNA